MLCALTAQAQKVSEEQALQGAEAFLNKKVSVKADGRQQAPRKLRQMSAQPSSPASQAYYVFNAEDNGGFVIVSGDERMGEILGYSTEGHFDPDKAPANMRAWLKGYEAAQPAQSPAKAFSGAAISPLIKTKWGQRWPYNLLTPEENGQHCVTGCVATTMAMVMNYWQYPSATVKDIPAWFGLSKVPAGTKIDWANMSDYYSDNEWWNHFTDVEDNYYNELYPETTEAQTNAVAGLMKMCGMAVNMNYGLDESTAQAIAPVAALKDYFGYKNEMQFLPQDNYTIDNWQRLIYHELEQQRPVMYGGIAEDMAFQGGHSFLIDGYDGDGFFHFNWGLELSSGFVNGYFTLSAQRFFKQTSAIVGIQPTAGGSIANVPTVGAYTTDASNLSLTGATTDGPVWAIDTYPGCGNVILTLKNNGSQLFKGPISIGATDEQGFTAWDNVLAEVPAGGSAQVMVPYYEFQLEPGKNTFQVYDFNNGQLVSGAYSVNVERRRIPTLNIEYTLDGVDALGLIKYGTPCTLRYKITSQWAGDPSLKARLRIIGLPSGEEEVRELGSITYGKAIEGSVRVSEPSWNPLPDFSSHGITPKVEFYSDTFTHEYAKYFMQNALQEGDTRTVVFCKKKPRVSTKAVKAEMEQLTPFDFDYNLRPAGYYVFGHDGFVGFVGMSLKDDLPSYYNAKLERAWKDFQDGASYYTGSMHFGSSSKKHLGIFDCPSTQPYASGSITKTLGGKTVYYPCNVEGIKEAASRGLYKNEVGTFLPYEEYVLINYAGGGTTSDDFFDDFYLYYFPIVDGVEGDVNDDGSVDVADIASVIDVMAGGSGIANSLQQLLLAAADVNGDGTVDVADIAAIIDIMAKQ